MRYLYKKTKKNDESEFSGELIVEVFTPKILGKLTLKGEKKSFKLLAVRFWFQIITHGKAKIYYIRQGENLVHTSYVVPKCYKFSFLNTNDYEIGPCFTYPEYRGKGVYPFVLKKICNSVGCDDTTFYMSVNESNISSIKGIEKAGFIKYGIVNVSKITKRYYLEKTL